jgi:prepilin peptidase CpaA
VNPLSAIMPDWLSVDTAAAALLLCIVFAAFVTDMTRMKIPNKLTATGIGIGFIMHLLWGGWAGIEYAGSGFAVGFGSMLILYAIKAVGAGDVKLFGAIGALGGWEMAWNGVVLSVVYAGAFAVGIWLWRRTLVIRLRMAALTVMYPAVCKVEGHESANTSGGDESTQFPFMIAVLPAMGTVIWLGGSL